MAQRRQAGSPPGSATPSELRERLRAAVDAFDFEDEAAVKDALAFLRTNAREFIDEISPDDRMNRSAIPYFPAGRAALRIVRLAMLESRRHGFDSILDFGSGFGRVLRMLKAAYPEARLTAADLRRDAVDFCARAFGATAVHSSHDPAAIELEGPFDLIWCGSVFTHFGAEQWDEFLPFFESLLAPRGLFVFTTLGRAGAERLRGADAMWGLDRREIGRIVDEYDRHGFGFSGRELAEGQRGRLGVSLSSPAWVFARIEQRTALRLVTFAEGAWGPQDAVACARGPFEPSLSPA